MKPDSFHARKFVLGTAQFGLHYGISNLSGQTPEEEVARILQYAWAQGVNTMDTASAYGNCEEVLGRQINNPFHVITKFSTDISSSTALCESLNRSLKKLQEKKIYGFLAHDAESLMKNPSLWKDLLALKEKGLIGKIGYSLYTPEQLMKLIGMHMIPDIVQLPFNFFDQRFKPYLKELRSNGTEIHARSVFLQGIFFMEPDRLPSFFDEVKPVMKKLQHEMPDKKNLSKFLLQFVFKEVNIDKLVIGVNNLNQLQQNLALLSVSNSVNIEVGSISERILMPSNWPKMHSV